MVSYRAILDLPDEPVSFAENVIATRRSELCSPWRALTWFDQAVLTLVWLRDGDTFAQLGRHFGISTDTAWRYATEAMRALAAHAPTLADALREAGSERRMILDGTLIPTARCATTPAQHSSENQDPYYSGKHHRPGVNAQALIDMGRQPAFAGQVRCGSRHDLTAARADGIVQMAGEAGIEILADSGYQGAGGTVRTPVKRPKGLSHTGHEKRANALHAAERAPVSATSHCSRTGGYHAWHASARTGSPTWSKRCSWSRGCAPHSCGRSVSSPSNRGARARKTATTTARAIG